MALVKRGSTWHTHFFVEGVRYRQSLETTDWREAQRKERALIADATAGKLASSKMDYANLPFAEAAQIFLDDRMPQLAPRSAQTERERLGAVTQSLGAIPVSKLKPEHVLAYIGQRKDAHRANSTVNRELDVIRGVLKRAKRWHHFADIVRPLPTRQKIGQALSYEDSCGSSNVPAADLNGRTLRMRRGWL